MVALNEPDQDRHMRVVREDVRENIGFPLFCWSVKDVEALDKKRCFFEVVIGEEVMNDFVYILMPDFLETETELAKLIKEHTIKFNLQCILHFSILQLVTLRPDIPHQIGRNICIVIIHQLLNSFYINLLHILDSPNILQQFAILLSHV